MADNVGEVVTIKQSNSLPNPNETALGIVLDQFQFVSEEAEKLLVLLRGTDGSGGYLGELNDSIQAAPEFSLTVPDINTDVTVPTPSAVPEWTGSLDDYPDDPAITVPEMEDIPAVVDPDDPVSSMPAAVSPNINFVEIPIPTDIYTDLLARLVQDLETGATGLSSEVEDAIFQRARDRQQIINDRKYNQLITSLDGMDFSLPSGALASALVEDSQDRTMFENELNNSILIQSSDLAQRNSQFVIQVSKDLEALIRQSTDNYNSRQLQFAMAQAQLILDNYKAAVDGYVRELEGLRAGLLTQIAHIEAVTASNRGKVDMFTAQWQAYSVQVNAVTEKNKGQVDVYSGQVQAYAAESAAIVGLTQAEIDAIKLKIEDATMELNAEIEEGKINLGGYSSEYQMRADVAKSLTQIVAQVTASMLAAISASAGADYNAGESTSETWSHHDQLGENHSYPHDPES